MARGMPSMLALLGLLAVAGYQNRDRIAGALDNMKSRSDTNPDGSPDLLGSLAGGLSEMFGGGQSNPDGSRSTAGGGIGDMLSGLGAGGLAGGLGDLLDSFKSTGQSEVADSWITPGVPTQGLRPDQVEQAIGADNLDELSKRTGLSRSELIDRLATIIPQAVDDLTPGGRMPTDDDLRQRFMPPPA